MAIRKTNGPEKPDVRKKTGVISLSRFVITYFLLMGGFFFLIGFAPLQKILDLNGLYTKGVVAATARVLTIIKVPCIYEGSIIQLPSIALDVKFGCNGLEAVMIYSVAVIAYPSSWGRRLLGMLAGFMVLQVVNVFRIAALAYSGMHFRGLFEYIHIYVAQGFMIAVSLAVFFVYLHYSSRQITASE